MRSKPQSKSTSILLVIVTILFVGGVGYLVWSMFPSRPPEQVVCTMEAKLCPDGSSVGRSGPNCEFVACPDNAPPINNDLWKTFVDEEEQISFQYPEQLLTTYITPGEWPPKVTVSQGTFSCLETSGIVGMPDRTRKRMVDDRVYCVTLASEGAAGSTYVTYTYTTEQGSTLITVTMTLRYPQCLNYDDPEQSACEAEHVAFDLDGLVDRMVSTVEPLSGE